MELIPDDPVLRCMERTGYPPWMQNGLPDYEDDKWEDDVDVFYGNQTSDF